MIYPSVEELSQNGKYNRYVLCTATAKCARMVTDEYVRQRDIRDEKAVKNAINRLYQGDYRINDATINLREEPEINDD